MQYPLHLHLGIEVSDADFWSIQEGGGGGGGAAACLSPACQSADLLEEVQPTALRNVPGPRCIETP